MTIAMKGSECLFLFLIGSNEIKGNVRDFTHGRIQLILGFHLYFVGRCCGVHDLHPFRGALRFPVIASAVSRRVALTLTPPVAFAEPWHGWHARI